MYDRKSDYAVNRRDPEAIIFRSVTGADVRLTRADFASDAEFERWKQWSDSDYRSTERRCRTYDDRRCALTAATPQPVRDEERTPPDAALIRLLREQLTATQLRRLRKHVVLGMSVTDIAAEENVAKPTVSTSLRAAMRAARRAVCP